jgi:hypothetical protein
MFPKFEKHFHPIVHRHLLAAHLPGDAPHKIGSFAGSSQRPEQPEAYAVSGYRPRNQ